MARVEQGHLPMMVNVRLVAFVADDAIDFVSDCPELGLLWCFLFHVYKVTQLRQKARDFFTINETFFVDKHPPIFEKNSYERLNFWSLGPIFKTLQLLNPSLFYLSAYQICP
jgi:hypothetical protein